MIANGKLHLILIRGWGHLTGVGGLRLSITEACDVQDNLAKYIMERLQKSTPLTTGIDYTQRIGRIKQSR